ncbi:MAG TPA: DUF1361 domain-containing protein [Puia sp.]|nr:DUF1361 domain-containing protein [Puia sp.]
MNSDTSISLKSSKGGRIFFLRTEMDRLLFLSMLFSCLLVAARIIHTGNGKFLFLIWNLFLAYIPYGITSVLARRPTWISNRSILAPVFLVWILFVPNSFYIITDLFHLGDRYNDRQAPQWFDLAMILSFVWNGLLLGVLSVRQMEHILLPQLSLRNELLFLYPIMWLNALGIYTGRYLRYNSWDLLTDPFQLLSDIASMIIHPLRHQVAWDMILCFSILMTLMYLMMKKVHKALI